MSKAGRKDKRARATGRLGMTRGERYALLPDDLLRHASVTTLRPYDFRVLVALAAQYHGANNGSLTLPFSAAKQYGIGSRKGLSDGLKELQRRGLIEITHVGGLPPLTTGCSRFALTWRQVGSDEKVGRLARAASHQYSDWKPAAGKKARYPRGNLVSIRAGTYKPPTSIHAGT